jgi:REP element-mobilizing transposase RayT
MIAKGPDRPQRRSIRLRGYDYAQAGAYFVTICTHQREPWLGAIADGVLQPSAAGEIAGAVWAGLTQRFPTIALDQFVVMPNHLHGIILLGQTATSPGQRPPAVGEIVRVFKAAAAWRIRQAANAAFGWQRNYYEHIIRDDDALARIRQYIHDNPARWSEDPENPEPGGGREESRPYSQVQPDRGGRRRWTR